MRITGNKLHLNVKKVWEGKAAIRGKYIDTIKTGKLGLVIHIDQDTMTLEYGTIKESIVDISAEYFAWSSFRK